YPEIYINMGLTAENVAKKYGISREDQDAFAYRSHQKAIKAWDEGYFDDQIVPVKVKEKKVTAGGEIEENEFLFDTDEGTRRDTSEEVLAKLRPVFKQGGTVTAGNSSQMNDAAAGVIVMSRRKADELGLQPIARYHGFSVAGVAPEI